MIDFAYPWLFLLLLLPVVIYFITPVYKERRQSIQVPYFSRLVDISGEKPQKGAVRLSRKNIQRFILALSWLCLVTSMAKPLWIGEPIEQKKSAREIMVAVDLSGSMDEEDFLSQNGQNINRLAAAKQVLADFAKGRKHDRLGLILFGDAPYLQAPFTDDIETWLTLLNETQLGMAGWLTTIGDAIGLSINVFENAKTSNRVLILLTDGTDSGSKMPPLKAATLAAAHEIKIYTIAMGDPKTQGLVKLDLATLQKIAETTGGKSFLAVNSQELQNVYAQINALEKQQYQAMSFRPRTSLHHYSFATFVLFNMITFVLYYIGKHSKKLIAGSEKKRV